ncbi:GSCOCG00012140001-RA-CDS [Cotesia congregata]|nr:GSCOCG00012140001-RA-CDS [Cotesia congregata]
MVKNKSMAYNLLLNGNHSGPVNFQDQCWFAYNTCPFDSIVQIIFNRALENHEFHDFLKNSKNKTFLLAAYFASMGLTSKTFEKIYTERFEILYQIYKTSELTQMEVETSEDENSGTEFISRVIDCFDNVNNLWNKIFLNEPSMFEKVSCLSSSCKDSQRNVPVMTVDYNIVLDRGFSNLEKAINFRGLTRDLYCKNCHEKNLIVSRTLNTYIYIELDVQSLNTKESKKCKLRELPRYLNFLENNLAGEKKQLCYRLSGVIGYQKGHYIAYCQSLTGSWRFFNDMLLQPQFIGEFTEIISHGMFYILNETKKV